MAKKNKESKTRWPVVHTNTVLSLDSKQLDTQDVAAIINGSLRSGMLRFHVEQFDVLVRHASPSEAQYRTATEVELDGGGACAIACDGDEEDSEVHVILCGDRSFVSATLAPEPDAKKKAAKKKK